MGHTPRDIQTPAARRTRRRVIVRLGAVGFTLAELLVAVSVVAILTLGIGRIFASVSKLVGTGAAVGEVDQIARVVEAQLRADLEAASRMSGSETFLAIRNRRVGDLDNSGSLDPGEVDIYITRDDEEADRRRNAPAYKRKNNADPASPKISRAVTVRLDQMMFIAQAPEGYRSFQPPPASDQVVTHALLMWGHGLRPPVDARNPDTRPRYRLNYPDGDFGFELGDDNPFAPDDNQFGGRATGRNRFAGDFVLTRRAVLLAGGTAAGEARISNSQPSEPMWGEDTEVAIYPSDMEASYLFGPLGFGDVDEADDEAGSEGDGGPNGWGGVDRLPNPRLLRHGRTDILAVDRAGLQRWIEGTGVPFTSGRISDVSVTDPPPTFPPNPPIDPTPLLTLNSRLWWAENPNIPGNTANQYAEKLKAVQTAIAGMFHRVLVEPEPPDLRVDAADPATGYPSPSISSHDIPDPVDRRMDAHAIIAQRCSSFEIAWSDGSTWARDSVLRLDANNDGIIDREIRRGDTIWFDMDFTVADFWRLNGLGDPANERIYPRANPDPEIGLDDSRVFDEMPSGFSRDQTHEFALNYQSSKSNAVDTSGGRDVIPAYSPFFNHAPFAPDGNVRIEQEYLAIWGFRTPEGADQGPDPASVGGYGRPWPKPRLIRVRMTLHDTQDRLQGGKQFEFVFRLNPGDT